MRTERTLTDALNQRRRNEVKRSTNALLAGFCLSTALFYTWRWYSRRSRIRNFHLTSDDLNYSNLSAEDLISEHLLDLNSASADQLAGLGLSAESQERLIENRPYRNKLELVSRMILSQAEYAAIKDSVSLAEANEPVKIASEFVTSVGEPAETTEESRYGQ
jgi:hypothetical protein